MVKEYQVERKLQEQSGSYFITLPKIWVDSEDLKQGDQLSVIFNGIVKIIPPSMMLETHNANEEVEVKTIE